MPFTERRTRRRLALRESIVEAAHLILRDGGARALTMRRIAEAIDYAPASLYAHFPSREALLAELCRDGLTQLRMALEGVAEGVDDPRERLVALGHGYVRYALDHADTYRLMFMEDPILTKSVFDSIDSDDGARAFGLIVAPLVQLRASRAIGAASNPAHLADLIWVTVHGIASLRLSCPTMPGTDDRTLVELSLRLILDGSKEAPGAS